MNIGYATSDSPPCLWNDVQVSCLTVDEASGAGEAGTAKVAGTGKLEQEKGDAAATGSGSAGAAKTVEFVGAASECFIKYRVLTAI